MPIYFLWHDKEHSSDLKVFELVISQREGEVALARLKVLAERSFFSMTCASIIYQDQNGGKHVLFEGRQIGFPRQIKNGLAEIELSAESEDADAQLKKLAGTLKIAPYYDELFIKKGDDNPVNVLEARSDLFHWDRVTGILSLSNLFQGNQTMDLSKSILKNSLKLKLGDTPLDSISVTLSCEWLQEDEGEVNIYPKIAATFPKRKVNTLTPSGLIAEWPKVGDKIGAALSRKQSGYQVVQSSLREIIPPSTGVLDIYPTVTPEITVKRGGRVKPIRLKRSWFKGELYLHWHYLQKRRENLSFTLHQESQLKGRIRPRQKHLEIQLQSIESHLPNRGCSSFFITDRGSLAVNHAMEMAKAYLAGTARCIEVEFRVPFDNAIQINLDTSVQIQSPIIPGGELIGKVVEYRLVQNGSAAYGWVRLAVAVGRKGDSRSLDRHALLAMTAGEQPEGILHPQNLTIDDLVRFVEIKNDAEEQTKFLLETECNDAVSLLNQMPTVVDIKLLDLRTKSVLEHDIHLPMLTSWSAPVQMGL